MVAITGGKFFRSHPEAEASDSGTSGLSAKESSYRHSGGELGANTRTPTFCKSPISSGLGTQSQTTTALRLRRREDAFRIVVEDDIERISKAL